MTVEGDLDVLELEGRATMACELDPVDPVEPVAPRVVAAPGAPRGAPNVELVDEEELA
jgi:hypothetical protein